MASLKEWVRIVFIVALTGAIALGAVGCGERSQASEGEGEGESDEDSLHVAVFRGIDNAQAIRQTILDRIKGLKSGGLGDPDELAIDMPVRVDFVPADEGLGVPVFVPA